MQTLSAESVPSMCWTAPQVQKELVAEIERTQALLQERKRIALTSPEVVRTKNSLKTKRNFGGRKKTRKGARK
jgi:uncharacterized small protein (DUF1192 family)